MYKKKRQTVDRFIKTRDSIHYRDYCKARDNVKNSNEKGTKN